MKSFFSSHGTSILHAELECQTSFLTPNRIQMKSKKPETTLNPHVHQKCSHIKSVTTQGTQTEGKRRKTACSFAGRFEVSDSNLLHPSYVNRRIKYAFNFRQISLTSIDSTHSSPSTRYLWVVVSKS